MLKYILYGLLIWFLYNLVFRFIIPLYKTTTEVKKKFREMHRQMNEQQQKQPGFGGSSAQKPSPVQESKKPADDYIDFEEIK